MPRLFYHCYDHQMPRGGQKETYRHVDILNEHGWEAYIYHSTENYRLAWFPNETKVIGPSDVEKLFDPATDYLVLPEDLGWRINQCPGRKVIFNKGLGLGFAALGETVSEFYPYQSPDVVAAFVMSEDNRLDLQLGFPMLRIYRMYSEVDPAVFSLRPLTTKKPLVAVVSKAPSLALSVFHTINARAMQHLNNGSRFEWAFLGKLPEREVASCLQDAVLVVYASETEGGPPRTLLEAMSCGCLLAPFCIAPIREGMPPYATFAPGDMGALVQFIEGVMASYPERISQWQPLVDSGRRIASEFSPARQSTALVNAWTDIAGPSAPITKSPQSRPQSARISAAT
jgi:glycosyltransferase involved in cell wall biosynthesis